MLSYILSVETFQEIRNKVNRWAQCRQIIFETVIFVLNLYPTDPFNCGCTYDIGNGHNIGTGSIVSKNYPGIYPSSTMCAWLISAPSGHHVTLTFSNMAVEDNSNCYYDSINVQYFILSDILVNLITIVNK